MVDTDFNNYTKLQELCEPMNAGEQELKDYLRSYDYKVIDVSNNPKYFSSDIDLFVQNPFTNLVFSIEVKWDSKIADTGNLFIELWADYPKKIGWWKFCKADLLFYGDAQNRKFYIFKLDELRAYIDLNFYRFSTGFCVDNTTGCVSQGLLVPVDEIPADIKRTIQL